MARSNMLNILPLCVVLVATCLSDVALADWYPVGYQTPGVCSPPPYCAPVTVSSPPPAYCSPPPAYCSPPPAYCSPPPVTVSSPPPYYCSPPPYYCKSPPPYYCTPPVTVNSPPPYYCKSPPPYYCTPPVTVKSPPPYCAPVYKPPKKGVKCGKGHCAYKTEICCKVKVVSWWHWHKYVTYVPTCKPWYTKCTKC